MLNELCQDRLFEMRAVRLSLLGLWQSSSGPKKCERGNYLIPEGPTARPADGGRLDWGKALSRKDTYARVGGKKEN